MHLGWALLELSDGLDFFKSVDSVSQTLAQLLFAAYLVIALILLINMLIALLSNVYQQVQVSEDWLSCCCCLCVIGGLIK